MAAAICLSPQALADPPAAQAATHHSVVADAAYRPALPPAQLLAEESWAKQYKPAGPSSPSWYTVRSGDSLSAIAGHVYRNPNAWPVLYWANHHRIQWANVIETGQVLRVPVEPAKIPAPPALLGPTAPPAPAAAAPASAPASAPAAAPASAASGSASPAMPASNYSGGVPGGSFGQCVVARESGGNAQVMNATGHYGLYQFSASTWAAYGGSSADFGHASVSEQNQVFANALAAGGQSNWSAYDGC